MAMDRTDSTAAMASLASYSMESDSEDDDKKVKSAVDSISDDENDTPTPVKHAPAPSSRPPSSLALEDNNSRSEFETKAEKKAKKRKARRLVSYGADELEEEESESESDEEESPESSSQTHGKGVVEGKIMNSSLGVEQASSLSRSVLNKSYDEIELPPEPPTKCSKQLQDTIASLYERKMKEGLNLNRDIQNRVDFRNPSIYEKLIEYCGIDEKGTNYPPELFDPSIWGKESYYDQLDKFQKQDMEKREKEKKERTKVEFVVGTKKASSKTEISVSQAHASHHDDKRRKSKWDEPGNAAAASRIADNINKSISGNVNLTSSATGTKSTVIPATGNITKKSSK